jgi:sialate O-acetylesterase
LLVNYTGMVWYRTRVDLTPAQAALPASLGIGQVDEIAAAWVNGKFAGAGSMDSQTYKLPADTLHAGPNVVAVNILNTYKKGGLIGPASAQALHFADGTSVPLSEPWRYDIVPLSVGDPPRAPWEPLAGLSMAYNGMIAPLGPYDFRGVVWYQGESDTTDAGVYRTLLSGLMQDWRRQFESDLPFLIVQLPNYGMPAAKPSDSNWAKLRDAQRAAVAADGNAALIVSIDIGEDYDVHPPNKQELGRRLALAAQRLIYGRNVAASGPIAESANHIGNRVAVTFSDRGLIAYGADTPIGFELCGAKSCRYATATISGDRVLLGVPVRFAATHVRYCWADGPICTLFDRDGLPAAPFDLPIKPSLAQKTAARRHASR